MKKESEAVLRLACLGIFLALLVLLGFASLDIRGVAGIYPKLLLASALLLFIPIAILDLKATTREQDGELIELFSGTYHQRAFMAIVALLWLLYPLLMVHLGFIASTTVLVILSCWLLEIRNLPVLIICSLLFSVLFAVALKTIIYVPVPSTWPDHMLDQAIYNFRRG